MATIDEYFQGNDDAPEGRGTDTNDLDAKDIGEYSNAGAADVDAAKAKAELEPIPGGGPLLEQSSASRIFRSIDKEVLRHEGLAKNRDESAKHWGHVVAGSQFSILEKNDDLSVYKQMFPPGVESNPQPIPNKVLDLRKKIISQILVDPFLPDPKPDGADSDRNRGAADLVKKFLRWDATPAGTNDQEMLLECLNINSIQQSAFVWVWVDPMGGGWRPMQKLAHPQATDASNPLVGPKAGPDGQPIIVNGQPITERCAEPTLRYVADGPPDPEDPEGKSTSQFTTDPAKATRQWMPKLRRRVLIPAQVRTFPATSTAFTASKITLLLWESLDEAKERFPILKTLTQAQLKTLCVWKPKRWKAIVPEAMRPKGVADVGIDGEGEISGDTLFFWYHHYCRIGGAYQDGAELAVTGGLDKGFLLRRDTLREDVELEDGITVPVLMDPPVAQFKALHDTVGGDPYGLAPVSEFGGANEIYAHLYTAILETIDKGLHPNVYIPSTSPISREDYNRRDGRPLEIMVPEDKPFIEPAPTIPAFTEKLLERVEMGMNSAAGTNQTSNGLDSSYSSSGVAKEVSIRQAKVALSQYYQNTAAGIVFYWMIKTQQARARLTVPQEVQLAGTESAYKQRYFVGADLLGVRHVPVATGSGTMMAPMEKLSLVGAMQTNQWIDADQGGEIARSNMTDDLGLAPNVHEEHIDRCIGNWLEGPSPEWEEQTKGNQLQMQQHQTATSQQVAALVQAGLPPDVAQAQVQQSMPAPQLVPPTTPFEPRPNDDAPGVAKVRERKLSRLLSTPDYADQPKPWRAIIDAEWTKAFAAAGGQTIAQQQAALKATQEAEQAAKATEGQPQFSKFVQDVQAKVISASEQLVAQEVQAAMGVMQEPEQPTEDPAAAAEASAQESERARLFQADESDKDRTHAASESHATRQSKLHESVFKAAFAHHNKPKPVTPATQIPPTPASLPATIPS